MLERISKGGTKLSELLRPFRERYFITGELNTPVADVPAKLAELEERFGPEGAVSHLDGLSVEAADWHFNVRPSNTEPLLRLNLEARSQELMERKRDEVLAVIRGLGRRSSSARPRGSASPTPMRRASSTTAATCRTSTSRGSSTTGSLDMLRAEPEDREFVMRAMHVEYHQPARFDDQIEVDVRDQPDRDVQRHATSSPPTSRARRSP